MHALETLFLLFVCAVPNRLKYRQNACFSSIVFKIVFAFQNNFKYRHSALFRDIHFTFSLQFQIVSITVRMYALQSLLFKTFSAVQNRFNYDRTQTLETLFSKKYLCRSKSCQILSELIKVLKPICNKYMLNTERKVFQLSLT